MTTTDHLQQNPDFFNSLEECKEFLPGVNTNKRYKYFKQTHFTAGDEEQFQRYRYEENGSICPKEISLDKNVFKGFETEDFDKYNDINPNTVYNTFSYIFNKFKKGIFIKILENKLKVFLPFSKAKFKNEWGHKIVINPKYGGKRDAMINFLTEVSKASGFKLKERYVRKNVSEWFANNCILRYDMTEGDTNVSVFKDMLTTLCETREIPDIELFINRRDFPILTKDGTEPYNNIWDGFVPLKSHLYKKYSPILSMSKTDKYADVLIPTHDDWARISKDKNKWFSRKCSPKEVYMTDWNKKKDIAVFRGTSTGCGIDSSTNKRIKLAQISKNHPDFLDAGITKWNLRPRKLQNVKYLDYIKTEKTGVKLANFLSGSQQSEYKYIIHVEGHVAAFRLSEELAMGSVLLMVESDWKIWYSKMLIPYVHYVPVKSDLSDIIEIVEWCRSNDDKCKKIAENATRFYDKYLSEKGILDFLQKTFMDLKKQIGNYLYNFKTPLDVQFEFEKNHPKNYFPVTDKEYKNIPVPYKTRSYGQLQAVNWILNIFLSNSTPQKDSEIFKNKLGRIYDYKFCGIDMVIKSTSDSKKIKEHTHERFIGTREINELVKLLPNFVYTFNGYTEGEDYNVIVEKIKGETLRDYLLGESFDFNKFFKIAIQLCLALKVAQNKCGFVHYDLVPWNIILQRLPQKVKIDYFVSYNQIYSVETDVIPVIIDYGKSHVIHKGKHYGFINMFNFSENQDIKTLLLCSLRVLLSRPKKLNKNQISNFMNLFSFIQPRQKKFWNAVQFIKINASYSNMLDMKILRRLGPLDLLNHITKKCNIRNFKVKKTRESVNWSIMDTTNSKQIFNFILSNSLDQKIDSFLSIFKSIQACNLPSSDNVIYNYYAVQKILSNLDMVYKNLKIFLLSVNGEIEKYEQMYKSILENIKTRYTETIQKSKLQKFNLETVKKINFSESTFLEPSKILEMVSEVDPQKLNTGLTDMREIITFVMNYKGSLQLPDSVRKFCVDNYSFLFSRDYMNLVIDSVNIKTLVNTSAQIYSHNIRILDNKNCKKQLMYYKLYQEILKKIVLFFS
jgi:hypothetical protein